MFSTNASPTGLSRSLGSTSTVRPLQAAKMRTIPQCASFSHYPPRAILHSTGAIHSILDAELDASLSRGFLAALPSDF